MNSHTNEVSNGTQSGEGTTGESGRQRSTIAFPYGSLRDAEQIAEALHRSWGGAASPDQLAGSLGSTPRSGSFRMKVASSKTFGAVNVSRGKISLTELGNRLIDPESQADARVEAFLAVPLFNEVFEAYKGQPLPPDPGLEQKIADLGVSPKQTAKARQALQRSAELAGFFKTSRGRLIRPATTGHSGESKDESAKEDKVSLSQSGAVALPLAEVFWGILANEGRSRSAEKTQDFVDAFRQVQDVMSRED